MTTRCRETTNPTAVTVVCRTTKCDFSSADTANHIIQVLNNRGGSLYELEACSVAMNGAVHFSGGSATKIVTKYGIVSPLISGGKNVTISIGMTHRGNPTTEEIQTTIEFYDATQRIRGSSFTGSKESYNVNYQFDLI
jgi:hypothetical protein